MAGRLLGTRRCLFPSNALLLNGVLLTRYSQYTADLALPTNGVLRTKPTNAAFTLSGVLSGSGLVYIASGSLRLTGNSTKTGGWTVNGGTLILNGGTYGAGILRGTLTINAAANTIIDYSNGEATYASDVITVNAGGQCRFVGGRTGYLLQVNVNNDGVLPAIVTSDTSTSGFQCGNGVLGQNGGVLSTGTGNGLANNVTCKIKLINNGGGTFTFNVSTAPLVISGIIDDFAGLTGLVAQKTGTGTLTLTNANTNIGGFNITAGTVVVTGSNVGTFTVASGATISAGNVTTATVGNLTFSALASRFAVNAITTTSTSKLTCAVLTAAANMTIDVAGTMTAGVYPILQKTSGASPIPTLGTNTTGRIVTFAWVANTLNMTLV